MGKKNKAPDLKSRCLETLDQNELLNKQFDRVSSSFRESHDYYTNNILPHCTQNHKQQYSYNCYLFSLVEEIFRFSHFALCDVYLYDNDRLDHKNDKNFFSSIYFLNNASFHIMGAWERTLRLSALFYGYDFTNISSKTKDFYEALKKMENFNNTEVFKLIQGLKSSNHFPRVQNLRINNDHRLSEHVKFSQDDESKKSALSCLENAEVLYKIISFYIQRLLNESFICPDGINLTNFNWQTPIESSNEIESTVSSELDRNLLKSRLKRCNEYILTERKAFIKLEPIINTSLTKLDDTSSFILYHSDMVFRLDEANRSLNFALCLLSKTDEEGNAKGIYFPDMDYTYFIESAITRIYSVYDKIAILLHLHTGFGDKTNTFQNFMRHNQDNLKDEKIMSLANAVYERQEYEKLHKLRQSNYHHMVKENYIHQVDSQWSHVYNMVLVSKNIEILKPVVKKIMQLFVDNPIRL